MKASELRIGNLIGLTESFDSGNKAIIQEVKVTCVGGCQITFSDDRNVIYISDVSNFEFIPLTEDWLIRMGFYEERSKDRLTIEAWSPGHPSQRFNIDFKDGKVLLQSRYQSESEGLLMRHIKYVHTLQNLYHALTGEELEIKTK